jgi:hypothetical protein
MRIGSGMEFISRAVFAATSTILMLLAGGLIAYGVYQVFESAFAREPAIASALLDAVGYLVIAIAVFDVAKYLLQEEVQRERELRNATEARRSLTKFISTIAIAVFLEALVMVSQVAKQRISDMIYPTLLLLVGIALIVGLGVFQRLSLSVEQQVNEPAEKK